MKYILDKKAVLAALIILTAGAQAQIVPQADPVNTNAGGTGAAKIALESLGLPKEDHGVLNNLVGPTKGWGRSRHDIQVYKLTNEDLPGVEGAFLRSSTVILDPKGLAPLHSHFERPAFLQVLSGSVFQHRSDATSFYMGAGDFTVSSHELAHWWINESADEPMRLWIVEICNAQHKCTGVVEGGAIALKNSSEKGSKPAADTIREIQLANEFKSAPKIGERKLRLRKITIKPGESSQDAATGRVAFLRLAEGRVSVNGEIVKTGSFLHAPQSLANHVFTNVGDTDAIIFAVDITNS